MGMFGKMRPGAELKCKHCDQRSLMRGGDWEALGKSQGWLIMACLKCGHGLRMGVFAERHVDKEFIDGMRTAKEKDLEEYKKRIGGIE